MPPRGRPKKITKFKRQENDYEKEKPLDVNIKNEDYFIPLKKKVNYKCEKCSKKFIFENSYKNHLINEHSETPDSIACKLCPVSCPNNSVLKKHILKAHTASFKCDICNKTFIRYSHVLRHKAQKACEGNNIGQYKCEICGARFGRKDNLMVHLRSIHISKKEYECKHCFSTYHSLKKLIIHAQKNHWGEARYECDFCGKITKSRAAIAKHLEIHGDRKFACEIVSLPASEYY